MEYVTKEIEVRLPLADFAERCDQRLKENDVEKGVIGWRKMTMSELCKCFRQQVEQLDAEVKRPRFDGEDKAVSVKEIRDKAVDVGNLAMMIFDAVEDIVWD